ncbi:hypothetical protein U9R90_33000 [Streptomyces sp. E11-3]|uniref:hypothetical protein n=1 Tax=Streptomyces sp. E11-3 TaxID=3110112 RepID=UPI003981693F
MAGGAGVSFAGWEDPADEGVYQRTVEACLDDHRVVRRLDARPTVTAGAVRAAMDTEENTARAMQPCVGSYAGHRDAVGDVQGVRAALSQAFSEVGFDLRTVVGWLACVGCVGWLFVRFNLSSSYGYVFVTVAPVCVVGGVVGWWIYEAAASLRNLQNQVMIVGYLLVLPIYLWDARDKARKWEHDLTENGTGPVVHQVISALLGDDPHSVFLPDSYDGLRAAGGRGYVVSNSATHRLERKLAILDGGTVAVCGPRGAGKSTLLDMAVRKDDFAVRTHVPATYTPHDFLVSLCVAICEEYMRSLKYEVPSLTRLSGFVRSFRRLRGFLSRSRYRLSFGVPGAGLVVLGSWAAVRSVWHERRGPVLSWAGDVGDRCGELARDVWQGDNLGVGLLITLVGLGVWTLRKSVRWRSRLSAVPRVLCLLAAIALVCGSLLSIGLDSDVRRHAPEMARGLFVPGEFALLVLSASVWACGHLLKETRVRRARRGLEPWAGARHLLGPRLFTPLALCGVAGFVAAWRANEHATAIVLDDHNPDRLVGLIAGWLLWRVARWRPKPSAPPLVTLCGDLLYRLKTVQATSGGLNLGASPVVSLGSAHSSSLSLAPVTFPELVSTVRNLLANVADEVAVRGHRTVITIDELDRLGTEAQARDFLNEIKAIFGVRRVFYLVSVAEDVGAAFIRRGLPHRDATDSSLDDVVHVQPCTIQESRDIISKRAPGLTPPGATATSPYVLLAHALSGGIPRDLVRYGRRIVEIRERTDSIELVDISRLLVLEELRDTLAGFRTLLSRHRWTPGNADVLGRYRDLMDQLQSTCACRADAVTHALERFAAGPTLSSSGSGGMPEDAAVLIDEASAYAYFGLTLLEVFSTPGFDQRSARAAGRGTEGHPQFLAEARLELSVSPHSARQLISDVRLVWRLPAVVPQASAGTIPGPREPQCPLHPRS